MTSWYDLLGNIFRQKCLKSRLCENPFKAFLEWFQRIFKTNQNMTWLRFDAFSRKSFFTTYFLCSRSQIFSIDKLLPSDVRLPAHERASVDSVWESLMCIIYVGWIYALTFISLENVASSLKPFFSCSTNNLRYKLDSFPLFFIDVDAYDASSSRGASFIFQCW